MSRRNVGPVRQGIFQRGMAARPLEVPSEWAWVWQDPFLRVVVPPHVVQSPTTLETVASGMRTLGSTNAITGTLDTAYSRPWTGEGRGLRFLQTSAFVPIVDVGLLSTTAITVVLPYQKTDGVFRSSSAFGLNSVSSIFDGLRVSCHLPFSDGVVYWDFGGVTAAGRTSVAGLTFGRDVWAFTAGPRRSEIWQNGERRAQNANATPTRSAGSAVIWRLGGVQASGIFSDLADYFAPIYIFNRQLSPAEIRQLALDPWGPFRTPSTEELWAGIPSGPPPPPIPGYPASRLAHRKAGAARLLFKR